MDDELTQALIESLSTPIVLTPLGQTVSNMEQKLEEQGLGRIKLAFIRKINAIVMETEEEVPQRVGKLVFEAVHICYLRQFIPVVFILQ